MTAKTITKILMLVVLVVLVGWDIYAAVNAQPGDTISEILLDWARKAPILAFAFGVVFGHLFWPQRVTDVRIPPV